MGPHGLRRALVCAIILFITATTSSAAILADSTADFSGTQGSKNWYYGYFPAGNVNAFTQLPTYVAALQQWQHATCCPVWTLVDANSSSHPAGTNNGADAATKKRLQFAYRIDTSLVNPLAGLPGAVANDPPPSLAQRNLIRSFELGLPTGQDVARAMGVTPLDDAEIVLGKAVDAPGAGDVKGNIASMPELAAFAGKCPLWTYILAEAARTTTGVKLPVTENIQITTPQLGPVGGRIVAEVFLGMLFGDNDSYLSANPSWTPTIKSVTPGTFALADLINYALGG